MPTKHQGELEGGSCQWLLQLEDRFVGTALAFRATPPGFRIPVDSELRLRVRPKVVLGVARRGLRELDRMIIGTELDFA